ncbi:MAG TPA: TolC family protein [Byssovorax sp.]|jgi:outer membrane protein TolC
MRSPRLSSLPLMCAAAVAALLGARDVRAQLPPPKPAQPAVAPPLTTPPPAKPIEVNDPLLTPVPPPAHMLTSWQDIVTYVNSRQTDLIIARAEIEKSRGAARQALALALPTVTATGSLTEQIITPPASSLTATGTGTSGTTIVPFTNPTLVGQVAASVPVLSLQNWYAIGTANRAVKATALTADDKARTVLVAIAEALVVVVTDERIAEVNRVGLQSSLQTLELTQRKQRLGSGTQLDVVRAQQDASNARATLITGDESLRKAREALGFALGFNDAWGVQPSVNIDQMGDQLRRICSPGGVEERPDMLAARANIEVAERGVTGSYLAYAPTIVASTTFSVANETQISGHDYAWNVMGLLTWSIWDGGNRYGLTRIAKATEVEAKATLGATLNTATQQTVQAQRNVGVTQASREVAIQTRDLAKETARLAQVAFEAGTGTSFDLVTSQAQARSAELNLAVAEFQVVQAKLEAMLAVANCKY